MTGRDYGSPLGNLLSRLRGFSTPLGGASWEAPVNQKDCAFRLLNYLEDRRVLFGPSSLEIPEHCVSSVLQMRSRLTDLIDENPGEPLLSHLLAMRSACRKFLEMSGNLEDRVRFGGTEGHYVSWVFLPAIGELRSTIGAQIALMSYRYQIAVPESLTPILPEAAE